MAPDTAPGWHGKLPALGDFASRRLDQAFLDAWDDWLSKGLLSLRQALGPSWLDAYLSSPSWRFLLLPGVLAGAPGTQAWAGVLMPSVDRAGRYFPFTIAQPLGGRLVSALQMPPLWQWLSRLDDLAADALHDDWTIDHLEAQLSSLAGPGLEAPAAAMGHALAGLASATVPARLPCADPAEWIGFESQALWQASAHGVAFWHADAEQQTPRLLRSHGMPDDALMRALLGGTAT